MRTSANGLWNIGISIADAVSQVTVEPQSCICPRESYTCRAYAFTGMGWSTEVITEQISYFINNPLKRNVSRDGVQVFFVEDDNILISQLFIVALERLNGKNFTCAAFNDDGSETAMVTACIIGEVIKAVYMCCEIDDCVQVLPQLLLPSHWSVTPHQ